MEDAREDSLPPTNLEKNEAALVRSLVYSTGVIPRLKELGVNYRQESGSFGGETGKPTFSHPCKFQENIHKMLYKTIIYMIMISCLSNFNILFLRPNRQSNPKNEKCLSEHSTQETNGPIYIYIYIYIYICVCVCVFANRPGDWGSNPKSSHAKNTKMVLDAA